jgi:ABC-type nitrate/sulfonate/bicarbonate transport system substrate-binding protein
VLTQSSLALTLAACAQSGTTGGSAAAPGHITFGEISTAPSHTPIYVAVGRGFFQGAGLDVTIQTLTGGTPSAMAAMATGSVDIMMAGAPEFIEYAAKKVIAGKIIAELQDSTFDVVVTRGIGSIRDLSGKVLAISGLNGGDQIYLEAVLRHYGVSPGDVTFITSGNATNRLTALSSGAAQATAASNSSRDLSEKVGVVLLKSSDSPVRIPSSMIFARDDIIAKHKDALRAFIKALSEATAWIKANPEIAATYCATGSGASKDACLSAFNVLRDPSAAGRYTWSSTYAIDTAATTEALAVEAAHTPEASSLKLEDLIDISVAGTTP